ncbi:hypothetical protein QBZ16_002112 [Prototheca wickerhamii]|uniref:EGF-like domain-containing protein n=1 Tax=Prototheca wickerhamii TaxID=3111 RepID=A0AAD9INI2_PROWI|nr:hypothetical protein QBZ16_002112 [Prototheca wickerhamii]
MRSPVVLLAVAFLLHQAGWSRAATFHVETNALRIKEPASYAGSFDSAIGDFGVPLYGGTLQGRIAFIESNPQGCAEFKAPLPSGTEILLVTRGNCFFKDTGDRVRKALGAGQGAVVVEFDWKESITHPDNRVEWELWFSTNTECGQACSATSSFLSQFKDSAVSLEQQGFTLFTPHVMLSECSVWTAEALCARNCIRGGRYCATSASTAGSGTDLPGASVVEQDLRHLCTYRVLNATGEAWRWWDYASRFAQHCTPAAKQFTAACAERQLGDMGVSAAAVADCVGDLRADQPHELLETQLAAQEDRGPVGRIIMLPTLIVNTNQYRGRLNTAGVLRALCAGFAEGTEPPVCLNPGVNVDECTQGVDTCWKGPDGASACVDTFRGYVCRCPEGWQGDGFKCEDIDECALGLHNCEQICINTPGSFRCDCKAGYKHVREGGPAGLSLSIAGVAIYRWKSQSAMQDEIRAIMRDYMPLDDRADPEAGAKLLSKHRNGRARARVE